MYLRECIRIGCDSRQTQFIYIWLKPPIGETPRGTPLLYGLDLHERKAPVKNVLVKDALLDDELFGLHHLCEVIGIQETRTDHFHFHGRYPGTNDSGTTDARHLGLSNPT